MVRQPGGVGKCLILFHGWEAELWQVERMWPLEALGVGGGEGEFPVTFKGPSRQNSSAALLAPLPCRHERCTHSQAALTWVLCWVLIFMQTRRNAKWLTVEMMQDGHQVSLLSGELTVDQRAAIIQRFRDGKEKVLITTNVCARGVCVCARACVRAREHS